MPVTRKWAYFDNAAVAPVSGPAQNAVARWLTEATEDGDTCWPTWAADVDRVRNRTAQLLNSQPDEVALVPNTTSGITLVAEGFPWKPGDNVVTFTNEFPTNQYPWLNLKSLGVETRRVTLRGDEADLDTLMNACDDRTRIVTASWVSFATGDRLDVDQLVERVHQLGAYMFLDAIQGLGVFPLNVQQTPVDFLAADGHKWLLGPEGAGVFYLRKEHLDLLRPFGMGWNSVIGRHDYATIDFTPRQEAARYEGGTWNTPGFLGLGASLDMLLRFGAGPDESDVGLRVLELGDFCRERLKAVGAHLHGSSRNASHSGIVTFDLPGHSKDAFRKRCLDAGVVLSVRNGRLRISPHAYCNEDDVERLISVVQSLR